MERTKDSLKVQALTQKIGNLVSMYEEQIADLRAEATITVETLSKQVENLTEENNYYKLKEENAVQEAPEDPEPSE